MSALAEALVAAQRRALSAMEKQLVAGRCDGPTGWEDWIERHAAMHALVSTPIRPQPVENGSGT